MTSPGERRASEGEAAATEENEAKGAGPAASGLRNADGEPADPPVLELADDIPGLDPGSSLDDTRKYTVVRRIGRGAMGAVYLVEHNDLGKRLAAKVVAAEHARNARAVARLKNEARTASTIEHENIVNVTDFGTRPDGSVFVIMELLRGQDLRARMEERIAEHKRDRTISRYLPDSEVRQVVRDILRGLGAAHGAGIVHRDLKPENVFLAETSGTVRSKLVDFGISKLQQGHGNLHLTGTGQIVGTPLYMAPEQAASGEVDGRADLYSLGALIYEMVTGEMPFPAKTVYEVLVKHATAIPDAPHTKRPDVPAAVEAIVMRCLEKDPAKRFATAEEMLAAWDAAFDEAALASTIEASGDAMRASSAARAAAARNSGEQPRPSSRGSMGFVVGACIVGALAVFGGYYFVGRDTNGASQQTQQTPAQTDRSTIEVRTAAIGQPANAPPAVVAQPETATTTVSLKSEPDGVEVRRDGAAIGTTPFDVEVEEGQVVELELVHGNTRRTVRLDGSETEVTERFPTRVRTPRTNPGPGGPALLPR